MSIAHILPGRQIARSRCGRPLRASTWSSCRSCWPPPWSRACGSRARDPKATTGRRGPARWPTWPAASCCAFVPLALIAPWMAWAWEHRLFTQSLDNVGSILLLFFGLEFFYYWYHRSSHTTRWFWAAIRVHHSPNQLNLSAAYRLGWLGRLTGSTLFFTPLVLAGLHADGRADRAVAEPALPVLAACRLDPAAGLAGGHVQHAVQPSRPPRAQSGVSRRQLRRRAGRLRPPVRHLYRRARRRAVRLRH